MDCQAKVPGALTMGERSLLHVNSAQEYRNVPFLIGVGVVVGYVIERTIHTLPSGSRSSLQAPSNPRISRPPERDPAMVAGAFFMSRVTETKQRLEKNPQDLEALIFLGNANYDITRFEEASEYYQKALAIDPLNIYVRTDLATSYYNMNLVDLALSEIRITIEIDPFHETALFNLGAMLLDGKNEKEQAIRVWEKLLKDHPNSTRAQLIREKIEELKTEG